MYRPWRKPPACFGSILSLQAPGQMDMQFKLESPLKNVWYRSQPIFQRSKIQDRKRLKRTKAKMNGTRQWGIPFYTSGS